MAVKVYSPGDLTPKRLRRWRRILGDRRTFQSEDRQFLVFVALSMLAWDELDRGTSDELVGMMLDYAYAFRPIAWPEPEWDGVPGVHMFGDLIADHLPDRLAEPLLCAIFFTPVHPGLRSRLIGNLAYVARGFSEERLQFLRFVYMVSQRTPVFADSYDEEKFLEIFERAAAPQRWSFGDEPLSSDA